MDVRCWVVEGSDVYVKKGCKIIESDQVCSSPTRDTLPAISMVLFPRYFLKFLYLPVCLTCKFPEIEELNDGVPGTESVQPAEKGRQTSRLGHLLYLSPSSYANILPVELVLVLLVLSKRDCKGEKMS